MRRTKEQKAITLIALIITIVILLILASVAISSITNDGILQYAQNAADNYNRAVQNEQDILQGYMNYLNREETENSGGSGSEEDTVAKDAAELDLVERYVLGSEKTGRSALEIADIDTETGNVTTYKDEASTIADASTTVICLNTNVSLDGTKGYVYSKYNNKVYKTVTDLATLYTESVEMVYKPEGREGQTVAYDSDLDGKTEEWVIITDRGGKVEIVSKNAMGQLYLGAADKSVNLELDADGNLKSGEDSDNAILSYNSALITINKYCKSLVKATNNDGVRSVGGTPDVGVIVYSSEKYDAWGEKITQAVSKGDRYYENDLIKMSFFGIAGVEKDYWISSRAVMEDTDLIIFVVRTMTTSADYSGISLWYLMENGYVGYGDSSSAVRPVIINPEGI